jgi:hypothetical protein
VAAARWPATVSNWAAVEYESEGYLRPSGEVVGSGEVCKGVSKTFVVARAKGRPSKIAETLDVVARYLVYKLYEATNGRRGA